MKHKLKDYPGFNHRKDSYPYGEQTKGTQRSLNSVTGEINFRAQGLF